VFNGAKDYNQFIKAIKKFGKTFGKPLLENGNANEEYNDAVGLSFEVYTEFFCKRYGQDSNPLLGIREIEDTSHDKFQEGYDFTYETFEGEPALLQAKFRSNSNHKFTRDELSSFICVADEEDIPKNRRILFTNVSEGDRSNDGLFHFSFKGGLKQMRVIAREHQEHYINLDPTFWEDFLACLDLSLVSPIQFSEIYTSRPHQLRMEAAQDKVLAGTEITKGKIIAATGAGKTLTILKGIKKGFKELDFSLQVLVAPTIDLLRQHHAYFEKFNLFHDDGINALHFRTGEDSKSDNKIGYQQTTKVAEIDFAGQLMILVTYASEQNLFGGLKGLGIEADCVYWDEFHHTVKQSLAYKEHLLSIPTKRQLFYSASEKRGHIITSLDKEVYGETLENISYAELRGSGILVPKINVKVIRINRNNGIIKGIENGFSNNAKDKGFILADAVKEAAGCAMARADMLSNHSTVNIITFSKQVAICNAIANNKEIRGFYGTDLNTVHAKIPGRKRKKIFTKVGGSIDSILLQYSVCKEGIDVTAFNSAVIARGLDVIGVQQGLGRIVRADHEDTKNLEAGLITLDAPTGWKKYSATVYFIIDNDSMEEFTVLAKYIIRSLEGSGLTEDDYDFSGIVEQRSGVKPLGTEWVAQLDCVEFANEINPVSIADVISKARIEIEQDNNEEEREFLKRKNDTEIKKFEKVLTL
jgi:superfamily II DNA or RNA helicase